VHTRLTGQLRLYADDVSLLGENTISVMYSEVRRAVRVEESMGEYVYLCAYLFCIGRL